jgi:hypothetical protein
MTRQAKSAAKRVLLGFFVELLLENAAVGIHVAFPIAAKIRISSALGWKKSKESKYEKKNRNRNIK